MSFARATGIVTCPNDSFGNPRPKVRTTIGETWVLSGMIAKGSQGVTTRDFLGADLRHFLRELRNKGIGIHDEWETDSFGRHKRWFLKSGHTLERIPENTKPATAATVKRVSNPNQKRASLGVSDEI